TVSSGRPDNGPVIATVVATLQPSPLPAGVVPPAIQTGVAQWPTVAASMPTPTLAPQLPTPGPVATNPALPAEAIVTSVAISQPGTDPNATPVLAVPFPDVPRLPVDNVKQLLDSSPVVIGDVRSQPEYEQGHIPGAIMLPGGQATGPVQQFPKEQL